MSDSVVETFEHLALHRPIQEVTDFLLHLDKKDVGTVRLKTKQLRRDMNNWSHPQAQQLRNRAPHLLLAGLATYTKQEALARSFDLPWGIDLDNAKDQRGYKAQFMAVLHHSRPSWLTDWAVALARGNSWQSLSYDQLRELEAAGLLTFDPWLYAQTLAGRLNHYNRTDKERGQNLATYILGQLQADATLLTRDLPLLFDYDTPADSAAAHLGKNREPLTWLTLLPQLVASGHLERADLLTRCLLALRRDFRRPLLTWFKNVFLTFEPAAAERLARQSELIELLAHPLPLVVNFALDQLKDLWTEPSFAAESLLLYADALMSRQDLKTGLKTLLGGFAKLLKAHPTHAPALASRCAAALVHADSAVQERAAKLLADILRAKKPLLTPAETADLTATIPTYASLLAPPARAALAPWLAPADATAAPVEASASYAPLTNFIPDISPATAIAPVADWHELLFLTGQVLKFDDPAAFERWLDGLLRLRGQFPAGYAQQLQPYLKQVFSWELQDLTPAQQATTLLHFQFGGNHVGQPDFIRALLASWFANFETPRLLKISLAEQAHNHPDPLLAPERQRLAVAETRLHPASPTPGLPLLSTPSHAPHWVAPTALVQGLLAHEKANLLPDPADMALALARTAFAAPADAAEALRLLPQLAQASLRELLEWFLSPTAPAGALPTFGASPQSIVKSLADRLGKLLPFRYHALPVPLAEALPWLWVVAARTRYPAAELPALRPLADYPGVAAPWQPGWHFEAKSRTDKYPWNKQQPEVTTTWTELTVPTEHPGQRPPSPLALYSLHARLRQDNPYYLWSLPASLPFLLTLVPNNPAPLHWHLLRTACRTDNGGSEGRDALQQVLHTLLAPGPALAESTSVLLAAGLTYHAPVCRALALEALLATVAQRRLVPAALGAALGRLLGAGFVPVQRLADGLAEIRAVDAATDDALTQTLAALLPELPAEPPRNTRKLLDAYADLLGRTRQPVPAPVQAHLREWQASAALKKTIASLLA